MSNDRKNATAGTHGTFDAAAGPPRGILQRAFPAGSSPGVYGHDRKVPAVELRQFITHYWMVNWELASNASATVETLPHPNVQLVFTNGDSASILIHGPHTAKFTAVLEGRAQVFGVKFRAGGFRAFYGGPVAALQDRTIDAVEVFGESIRKLAPVLAGDEDQQVKIAAANEYFVARAPRLDDEANSATSLVDLVLKEPEISSVSKLSERTGMSERTLQRLFREYVGVSPKWVILRYRLHEVVERLNAGGAIDWADTAAELGYFDQSHLIRDFRRITGYAPERYRRL